MDLERARSYNKRFDELHREASREEAVTPRPEGLSPQEWFTNLWRRIEALGGDAPDKTVVEQHDGNGLFVRFTRVVEAPLYSHLLPKKTIKAEWLTGQEEVIIDEWVSDETRFAEPSVRRLGMLEESVAAAEEIYHEHLVFLERTMFDGQP